MVWLMCSGLLLLVTPQSGQDGVGVQKGHLVGIDIKARKKFALDWRLNSIPTHLITLSSA